MGEEALRRWRAYVEELGAALAAGDRDAALACFMRLAGASDDGITAARRAPVWPELEALAHTLAYDAACLGDGRPPADRLARITAPALVLTGGTPDPHMAGLAAGYFAQAADTIAAALPHARRLTLAGQSHVADPAVLAPVLTEFLAP